MRVKASSFFWVSFAMVVGVMGTALISPLYALYQDAWQLKASDISLIYVIYMAGALCGLLFLGRLPDRLGFRPMLRLGLILALLGTLITLAAWDLVRHWTICEREALRHDVPRLALDAMTPDGETMREFAGRVLDISAAGLTRRARLNSAGDNEGGFLDPLRDVVLSGMTPADRELNSAA